MSSQIQQPIVFVVGATGTGKTAWALKQAAKMNGAIVNADSVQFYRGLDIGTAKPTAEERQQCPHYLFDVSSYPEKLTAGIYRRVGLKTIEDHGREHRLFFVGGSGFYLNALENGLFDIGPIPAEVTERVNSLLQKEGVPGLHAKLVELDPEYSELISPTDSYRLQRALAVIWANNKSWTELKAGYEKQRQPFPYKVVKIGFRVPREKQKQILGERVEKMIQAGLEEEVKGLLDQGFEAWEPLRSVGYAETVDMIQGRLPRSEWKERIVISTMQLSKRQTTWFQRDPQITWFDAFSNDADAFLDSKITDRS